MFLPADVHKKTLHQVHMLAWKKGVKSLYYCRSRSIQRADVVSSMSAVDTMTLGGVPGADGDQPQPVAASGENDNDYEECLSCQ